MTLSTSRVVSSCSKSGFSAPGVPTRASTAVPPLAALGTVAIGWQAPTRTARIDRTAAAVMAAGTLRLPEMLSHPDVGNRADEEGGNHDPGGPVDLALEAPARPVATTQAIASTADRPAQARRLGCLHQHPGHQEYGEYDLEDDERVFDPSHGNRGILALQG